MIGATWHIAGPLDVARLQAAIARLEGRHAALRCRYGRGRDGAWGYRIVDHAVRAVQMVAAPGAGLGEVRRLARQWMLAPVDLQSEASLVRFGLVNAGDQSHWLVVAIHHSLSDGVTLNRIGEELFALYGEQTLPLVPGFDAVVPENWGADPRMATARLHWERALEAMGDVPVLPGDVLVPDRIDLPNGLIEFPIPSVDLDAVERRARALGATPFNFYHAALHVLLGRIAGHPQVPSAFQSAGRRLWQGGEESLGAFSNALAVAPEVDPDAPFDDLVRTMRRDMKAALAHEIMPLHEVARLTGVNPMVGINWYPPTPPPASAATSGLSVSAPEQLERRFDYAYNLRFMSFPSGVTLALYTDQSRISPALARCFGQAVLAIAHAHAHGPGFRVRDVESPDLALPDRPIPMATTAEPDLAPLGALVADVAARQPDHPAIRFRGARTTYATLETDTAKLERQLRAAGAGPGSLVGILADRGPALVVGMLASLRTGAAFVVLDRAYPEPRLDQQAGIARPTHLLWAGLTPIDAAARAFADRHSMRLLDPDGAVPLADPGPPRIDPGAPAYLLFTSGSTGTPKCLAVSHRPLQRFLRWQAETFGLQASDRFSMLSGLSHDPLMRDVFAPLLLGAELLIPEQGVIIDPGELNGWIAREEPTIIHLTPPLGRLLARAGAPLPSVRAMFWGGDQLTTDVVRAIAIEAPGAMQVNLYGATETPQAAAFHRVDPAIDWRAVPIGRATDGHVLAVARGDGRTCRPGETGGLTVAATELTLGQIVDGQLQPVPPPGPDGLVHHATGDRALVLPDGTLQLIGRADDQVKVRGYRIELAEVRHALFGLDEVVDAHVLAVGGEADRQLSAIVVPAEADAEPSAILAALARRVPAYMLPQRIHLLPAIPLLPNGKPDRQAMRTLAEAPVDAGIAHAPRTEQERAIASAWAGILGRPVRSVEESFATLGGDSLSFVEAYVALEERLGQVPEGWQFLSIRALAAMPVQNRRWWRAIETPVAIRAVAIVMVLFLHFGVYDYGGGATAAMFMVTGYLLGGMQFAELQSTGSGRPFGRLLLKLVPPVFLFGVAMYGIKLIGGRTPDWSLLLMTSDMVHYGSLRPDQRVDYQIALWYVHAMIHILLLFGLLLPLAMRVERLRRDRFALAMTLFGVGLALKFGVGAIVETRFLEGTLPRGHWLSYVPTSHIATLAFGALLAAAVSRPQRQIAFVALIGYVLLSWLFVPRNSWQFLLVGGLLLLLVPYLKMPRPVVPPLLALSSASLFIYLLHQLIRPFRWKFDLEPNPWVEVVAGLVLGLIGWWVWTRFLMWVQPRLRRHGENGRDVEAATV